MKIFIKLILLISLLASLSSCNNDVDDMIEDYNKGFLTTGDDIKKKLQPGDEGYDESTMLMDKYFLSDIETLNLSAPPGCRYYFWSIEDYYFPEKGSNNAILQSGSDIGYDQRRFVLYVPESGLEPGAYKITLSVRKEAKWYTDACVLYIYKNIKL